MATNTFKNRLTTYGCYNFLFTHDALMAFNDPFMADNIFCCLDIGNQNANFCSSVFAQPFHNSATQRLPLLKTDCFPQRHVCEH
jgi:hypothetical protein